MSLLLYGGPNARRKQPRHHGESDCDELAQKAKAMKKWLHPKLKFEEIVKNKSNPVSLVHQVSKPNETD